MWLNHIPLWYVPFIKSCRTLKNTLHAFSMFVKVTWQSSMLYIADLRVLGIQFWNCGVLWSLVSHVGSRMVVPQGHLYQWPRTFDGAIKLGPHILELEKTSNKNFVADLSYEGISIFLYINYMQGGYYTMHDLLLSALVSDRVERLCYCPLIGWCWKYF